LAGGKQRSRWKTDSGRVCRLWARNRDQSGHDLLASVGGREEWRTKMKQADEGANTAPGRTLRVLSEQVEGAETKTSTRILPVYDASVEVGLCVHVHNAATERTDEGGEVTVELPKLVELLAAAAVARCLMPIKLRGSEIKAMRKIMGMTLADLAGRLDERTAPETVSRWESEAQPMGGYAERLLRLLVCEKLQKQAPGIEYNASMIADLRVPGRLDPTSEPPCVQLWLIHLKEESGAIIDAWNDAKKAA
jgi:DNA-binding transcriptional regulator YiaG